MGMAFANRMLIICCLVTRPLYGKMFTFIEYDTEIDGSSGKVYGHIGASEPHRTHDNGFPNCERNNTALTCKFIPNWVPRGITNVIVYGQTQTIKYNQFSNKSWTQVDSLHIEGENFNLRKGGLFIGLSNLSTLFLNSSDIDHVNSSCFEDLDGLKNLTLAGMYTLDGCSLQSAFSSKGILPKLKYFALNSGKTLRSPVLQLQYRFLESLVEKRIECLNLSNVIVEVQFIDLVNTFLQHSFNVVNLTGSHLIINNYVWKLPLNLRLPLVTTLDTSYMKLSYGCTETGSRSNLMRSENNITYTLRGHYISDAFFLIENFYAKSIFLDRTEYQGILNYSLKLFLWKKVVFSGNNIAIMNATFILPQNNTLLYMDLSNNQMEYISHRSFPTCFALQVLDLSINKLYLMEHFPEFEKLLLTYENLRFVNLASNNISFIPKKMFHANGQLETLILANNRLTSICFYLEQFTKLRWLDMRTNKIKFLQEGKVDQIQSLQKKAKLKILFQGNPILCSCETRGFISWLATLRGTSDISGEKLRCEYVGSFIDINEDAVGKCRYICNRTMIIAVSISCSLIVFLVFVIIVRMIQKIRKRKRMGNIECLLQKRLLAGHFMCFIAMSGKEEEFVNRVILITLRRCLQVKVNLDREIVCTGNRFKPGFPICEESYRLLKKSLVFMAVVSDAFLRSQYCRLELQEACKQDKTTILLFRGEVDTTDMPDYMREVFKRNSRAWIKQNDEGYYYVVPSVQDISDSIWDLALADLIRKV